MVVVIATLCHGYVENDDDHDDYDHTDDYIYYD